WRLPLALLLLLLRPHVLRPRLLLRPLLSRPLLLLRPPVLRPLLVPLSPYQHGTLVRGG
ncbi:unnamed protein product, partial [Closterium sp. NIES-53]